MAPRFDSQPPSPNLFSNPKPRPPKSPAQVAQIRVRNRRREYLERNPGYFESAEHEFADPLLYDSLIRGFHTPAERETEGRQKGYSRILESSLLRSEARLVKLASTHETADSGDGANNTTAHQLQASAASTPGAAGPQTAVVMPSATGLEAEEALAGGRPASREEARARWEEFLRDRFVRGGDEDFDYRPVDEDDSLDVLERKDLEEAWFDDETPDWASTEVEGEGYQGGKEGEAVVAGSVRPERILHGETGVQDF